MKRETFIGKCLIRKAKNAQGENKLIICGVFELSSIGQSFDQYHDNDEMWAVKFEVQEVIKHKNLIEKTISPEDFLMGKGQLPQEWKIKEEKKIYY